MIIAIDFDGTVVTHDYPEIGKDIGAVPVLLDMVKNGHRLILYTMRHGKTLEDAVKWFSNNKIPLWGVNENPEQKSWTDSIKVYAQLYIDDATLGCPLKLSDHKRPYVDWKRAARILTETGVIL
jgi:hypothetical protein